MVEGGSMVPGDGAYEKLEHQSRFLRERGLTSPEMQECDRRLSLFVRLAGGNSTKLDPGFLDQIHAELADAAVKQLKVSDLFEQWLDAWDVHNGIEVGPSEEHSLEVADVAAGQASEEHSIEIADVAAAWTTTVDRSPAEQQVRELAAELREIVRALSGEPTAGVSEVASLRSSD